MKKCFNNLKYSAISGFIAAKTSLANTRGENYVDTAIKILIAVVLGALLLAGLYALFGNTVLPTLTRRVQEMFEYNG
jgi:hypothetical protein